MKKSFTHPLARKCTVTKAHCRDGSPADSLLIVTTLELDPAARNFKADKVARLHEAARNYLAEVPEIKSYAMLNRPKDWNA